MENNIVNFIEAIRTENFGAFELFEAVKNDERLLYRLCDAVFKTYGNLEHIKKFIG